MKHHEPTQAEQEAAFLVEHAAANANTPGRAVSAATRRPDQAPRQCKPFRCPECNRGFDGPDLLNGKCPRHARTDDEEELCPGSEDCPVKVTPKGRV